MANTPEKTEAVVQDEEIEETPGYVPPAQKSLKEIEEQDQDDESLIKYKKLLLGEVKVDEADQSGPNVVVEKLSINFKDCENRPDVVLDLTGDISELKKQTVSIKEGSEYRIKITFKVKREIVAGLKYFQLSYRKGIKVDKATLMVGSYGPKAESHEYLTPFEEAPSGMLARGTYTIKSRFTDDDKNNVLSWEWSFEISKDWK